MLLLREVSGWLRYCLSRDPVCRLLGIVSEEISSQFIPIADVTDGCRTLAIYQASKGMTPRIEMRFTVLHPQIVWVEGSSADGQILQISNPYGFPGDGQSWDVSDAVEALVALAREKFGALQCQTPVVMATIDFNTVKRVVDSAHRAWDRIRICRKDVETFLKKSSLGSLSDFQDATMAFFKQGKLKWKDIEVLQTKGKQPQDQVLPWEVVKAHLVTMNDAVLDKLPDEVREQLNPSEAAAKSISAEVDSFIEKLSSGEKPVIKSRTKFCKSITAGLETGELPMNYLECLSACDPAEAYGPWSWISRQVIAYEVGQGTKPVTEAVIAWLDGSDLLAPLYCAKPEDKTLLRAAVHQQIEDFANNTLRSKPWAKSVLESISGLDDLSRRRALQAEFDMWVIHAMSPSASQHKLPLSAYAFSSERKDQQAYSEMFGSWLKELRDFSKNYRQESLAHLTTSLKQFLTEVLTTWEKPELENYKPKVPSVAKIISSVTQGDRKTLLALLVEDFENELGQKLPDEVQAKLNESPFFNSVYREVRIQSVKL